MEQANLVLHFILFHLTFATLWVNSADDNLMTFSHISQKVGIDISFKLSKLFSGKNKENVPKMPSSEYFPSMLSVKQ